MESSLVPALQTIDRPTLEPIATQMADAYVRCTARIIMAMTTIDEASTELGNVFSDGDKGMKGWDFGVGFCYRGEHNVRQDKIFDLFKRSAWNVLANRLGIKSIMSMKQREEFDRAMEKDELPEINSDNIMSMIMGLVGQADDFAKNAVLEVFEFLRSRSDKYVTNKQYRIGKRVILQYTVERWGSGKWHVNYSKDGFFRALNGVMRLLDGKTPVQDGPCEMRAAVMNTDTTTNRSENDYFRWRCFKNGNLHLEFKRIDLLQSLNQIATGSNQIGDDE